MDKTSVLSAIGKSVVTIFFGFVGVLFAVWTGTQYLSSWPALASSPLRVIMAIFTAIALVVYWIIYAIGALYLWFK